MQNKLHRFCKLYNHYTNPAVCRSDEEHSRFSRGAKRLLKWIEKNGYWSQIAENENSGAYYVKQ